MSRKPPFTFYEFFAGGGMARLGLGESWDCLFANDFDPSKAAAYRANFGGDHLVEGDVHALTTAALPGRADLAWASSPCQDFSLAGGRAGLAGGRSSAFFGFWRLIGGLAAEGRAPAIIVVENVVGLLTSNGGRDFAALARAFAEAGYRFGAVEADASAFLPQSRPRVLIIAARHAAGGPAPGAPSRAVARARDALPRSLRDLWIDWPTPPAGGRNADLAALLEPDSDVPWHSAEKAAALITALSPPQRRKLDAALASGERRVGALFRRTRQGRPCTELRFDGLAGCLRTPRGGSSRQAIAVVEGGRVRTRLITPREAARLMGLPDSYRLPASANKALHVTGDGVAVPVVRWLAEAVLEPLLASRGQAIAAE